MTSEESLLIERFYYRSTPKRGQTHVTLCRTNIPSYPDGRSVELLDIWPRLLIRASLVIESENVCPCWRWTVGEVVRASEMQP